MRVVGGRQAAPFRWRAAGENLGKGARRLVTDVVDEFRAHPVRAGLELGAVLGGSVLFPDLAAAVGVVGAGIAAGNTAKALWDVADDLSHQRPREAEADFEPLGEALAHVGVRALLRTSSPVTRLMRFWRGLGAVRLG